MHPLSKNIILFLNLERILPPHSPKFIRRAENRLRKIQFRQPGVDTENQANRREKLSLCLFQKMKITVPSTLQLLDFAPKCKFKISRFPAVKQGFSSFIREQNKGKQSPVGECKRRFSRVDPKFSSVSVQLILIHLSMTPDKSNRKKHYCAAALQLFMESGEKKNIHLNVLCCCIINGRLNIKNTVVVVVG